MKKSISFVVILAASMLLNGCGTNNSKLGTDLATAAITGAVANGANGTSGLGSLASILTSGNTLTTVLTSLLGTKTTANSLVGTWTYSQPKVVFESESVLAKIGSSVASSKIESSLNSQLKKIGFTAGKSTITFDANGNYTMALGSKTYTGTYTYNTSTSTMTMKGALGVTSLSSTVTVNINEMYMLFSADKILSIASSVSTVNSTLSSLLSNYNGLKLGWAMVKTQ